MKKKDILKAIDKKNVNSSKKSGGKKTTTKKKKTTTSNKKTTPKKQTVKKTNTVKENKVEEVKVTEQENKEEKVVKDEKKDNKDVEYVEVEVIERTPKEKLIRFGIGLGITLGVLLVLLLLFLSLTEYRPEKTEKLEVIGDGFKDLNPNDTFTVMTWNLGYGALGDNADYYKNGGKMVQTADRTRVDKNMKGVLTKIDEIKPNILMVQEVDTSSKRSSHVNELTSIANHFNAYSYSFAMNYSALYIPFPINDTIGSVNSGIANFSKFTMESSKRISIPSGSIWPFTTTDYKRCFLVSYIPIKDSEKQLVLINVHLDDNNKGREKEIKKLVTLLEKETKKENYIIVGGDFNSIFSSKDQEKYKVEKGKWTPGVLEESSVTGEWQFLMDDETPSCRSLDQPYKDADKEKFQYYLIDGFITSTNLKVNSIKTQDLGFVSSDHNPVVMNVTLS